MDNPETEISKLLARETVSVRKPEKGTKPKLFYIDGDRASLDPSATNPDTDYMWSSQTSGVGHFAKFAEKKIAQKQVAALVQIEPREKKARRVYDAPNKGVLWGWEVSAYILTKAIAAGAFLIPVASGYFVDVEPRLKQIGAIVALVFLAITGVLLIMDLGRPDRFLSVLLQAAVEVMADPRSIYYYGLRRAADCLDRRLVPRIFEYSKVCRAARNIACVALSGLHRVSVLAGKGTRFLAKSDAGCAYARAFGNGRRIDFLADGLCPAVRRRILEVYLVRDWSSALFFI